MELSELMQRISTGNIPHFLVLFGEEQKIVDIYIDNICKKYKKVYLESVSEAIKKSGMKSLDKSKKAYIVNEDKDFLLKEEAWENIINSFKHNILIVRYHTLDKRGKFYNKNKQNSVEFTHLSDNVLNTYINRDCPGLSEENAIKIIKFCNNDYGRICMEIDKIKNYYELISIESEISGGEMDYDECFEELEKQGIFRKEIGDITFQLTDAVLGGYAETAIKKLYEAKLKGEPVMMISSILYNGFRNLLAYQGVGANKTGVMEKTGMTKGEIYRCSKLVGGYSIKEIIRNIFLCQKVESGIKTGWIDEEIALEYLVLSCLK